MSLRLRTLVAFSALSGAAQAAPAPPPAYVQTPFGRAVREDCLHEVPSGAHSAAQADGSTLVTRSDGTSYVLPKCGADDAHPTFRFPAAAAARASRSAEVGGLPPNYDGWLSYTGLNVTDVGLTGGFDSFTSTMSVPDTPADRPQILYFFPGLQNINWIPKVDPEPTDADPFDIIQPVLQYPGGFLSRGWALKSWYVTVNAGALYSNAITGIQEGDAILCNMTRTGKDSWSISGQLKSSGKATTQSATNDRLAVQPWAYSAVTECYGCDGCGTFPTKPITFTDNKLCQAGKLVDIPGDKWNINAKPPVKFECHEKTTVASNGDATTTFQ